MNWPKRKYFVATPNHSGTKFFNNDIQQSFKLWLRQQDLSKTIDSLEEDETLANNIDIG